MEGVVFVQFPLSAPCRERIFLAFIFFRIKLAHPKFELKRGSKYESQTGTAVFGAGAN